MMATDTSLQYGGRTGQDTDLYTSGRHNQPSYPSPAYSQTAAVPQNMFNHSSSYIQSPTPRDSQFPSGVLDMGRDNEIILPPWQSDAEVTSCPICEVKFSLFNRKHHCRKCGRVVCGSCSPHRITIPTQYIVRPEHELPPREPAPPVIDLTGDDEDIQFLSERRVRDRSQSHPVDPNLSGGQEVRICNPCVPDPNPAPPPQPGRSWRPSQQHTGNVDYLSRGRDATPQGPPPDYDASRFFLRESVPQQGSRSYQSYNHNRAMSAQEQYMGLGPAGVLPTPEWNQPQQQSRTIAQQGGTYHPRVRFASQAGQSGTHSQSYSPNTRYPARLPSDHAFTANQQIPAPLVPPRASSYVQPMWGLRPGDDMPTPPSRLQQAQPQPQPQLREEDYCPICQLPLPPKGPDGSEDAREQHVASCEEQYFGTSAHPGSVSSQQQSQSYLSGPAPPSRPQNSSLQQSTATKSPNSSAISATTAASSSSTSSVPMAPRSLPPARRHTASGPNPMVSRRLSMGPRMITYLATEKDCLPSGSSSSSGDKESGKPDPTEIECVICFEDFEVGAELARLECLCRFHKKCIKDWWDVKGKGSCPIHLNWH